MRIARWSGGAADQRRNRQGARPGGRGFAARVRLGVLGALVLLILALLPAPVGAAQNGITMRFHYSFELPLAGEAALVMRAQAPGTGWRRPGAEAAVVRLDLDGKYNQHVILTMGAEPHDYRVLLGPLAAGAHRLSMRLDRKLSARGARGFVARFEVRAFQPGAPEYEAIRYAPILAARPDTLGRATDAPLLSYYEWLPPAQDAPPGAARMLQFTCIFSNEDGGTNTPALMARWGRTTDIEHVYRLFFSADGEKLAAIFQGVDHKETPLRARTIGTHPLIGVASKNNNFSDRPLSRVRYALWPEPAELADHSREEVMDRHAWTYRVMADELEREGKLAEVADPRRYLYIEARITTTEASASFGVVLRDGREFRSDGGHADRRIERSGWVRSTVELPAGTTLAGIAALVFHCDSHRKPLAPPVEERCVIEAVSKYFLLDEGYRPGPPGSVQAAFPVGLTPGASARLESSSLR